MRFIKLLPLLFILTLFNTSSYAESCEDIKMDSSVNIIKKLKCKAGNVGSESSETTEVTSSEETTTSEETKEKKGILGKLFQKPKWMKNN